MLSSFSWWLPSIPITGTGLFLSAVGVASIVGFGGLVYLRYASIERSKAVDRSDRAGNDPPSRIETQREDLPAVMHDIMLRAGRGEETERVPVWAMRQAGRYLPEFMKLRNFPFLERVHNPELAAEITLQPLRRYIDDLDAVVIFSDILIVPPAMGIPVVFNPGPQFEWTLKDPGDLHALKTPNTQHDFAFLLESIARTRRISAAPSDCVVIKRDAPQEGGEPLPVYFEQLSKNGVGKAVPIIGFVGAPWTLMSYMIDGDVVAAAAGTAKNRQNSPAASTAASQEAGSSTPTAANAALPSEEAVQAADINSTPARGSGVASSYSASSPSSSSSSVASPTRTPTSAAASATAPSSSAPPPPAAAVAVRSHKSYELSKKWLLLWPEASQELLNRLVDILVDLLVAQYVAGAHFLQVFETNAVELSPARFSEFALPALIRVAAGVRARVPPPSKGGPILSIFARGASFALEEIVEKADYDVISLDWSTVPAWAVRTVKEAAARAGKRAPTLQGNLDPCELFGTESTITKATKDMLTGFGSHPLIGNLGHGMLPSHTPEALGCYFRTIREFSTEMRGGGGEKKKKAKGESEF